MTTGNLGDCQSQRNPNALAMVDLAHEPREFTYAELDALTNAAGQKLLDLGIRRGDRVGLLAANSAEYVAALFGTMRIGAVAVPINYRFPDDVIHYVLEDTALRHVFCEPAQGERLPAAIEQIELSPGSLHMEPAPTRHVVEPEPDELAMVLYTSGSTGRPKGVLLSHASQLTMLERLGSNLAGLTGMVAAPLYHMNGQLFLGGLLYGPGTVVLAPRFQAQEYLRALDRYRVNLVSGVPTMLALMAREETLRSELDLSCVISIQIGSAPLSETVVAQAQSMFPNARLSNGYGTTEAGAMMFGPHPDGMRTPVMSLGYPSDHVEVRLTGGEDNDRGVLEVRTPSAMSGYLNLPDRTAEKMSGDGWISTGDIMKRDANGFFYFVGRDDDMFVCNGENVFPGEVERLLEADSRIAEACVVPREDAVRGHVPIAFVVAAGDVDLDEDAVKQIALDGAPAYMHPRRVLFLDTMPLAGTNKIDRALLTQWAARAETDARPDA